MTARDELIEVMAEGIAFAEQFHAEDYRVQHGAEAALLWIETEYSVREETRRVVVLPDGRYILSTAALDEDFEVGELMELWTMTISCYRPTPTSRGSSS